LKSLPDLGDYKGHLLAELNAQGASGQLQRAIALAFVNHDHDGFPTGAAKRRRTDDRSSAESASSSSVGLPMSPGAYVVQPKYVPVAPGGAAALLQVAPMTPGGASSSPELSPVQRELALIHIKLDMIMKALGLEVLGSLP
jgi:hypothetical protein